MNDQQQQQQQQQQQRQQTPLAEEDVILASGSYDHTIKFWTPHNGKSSRTITHQNSQVNDLKITPDRTYLAAAGFQHIRMYNLISMHNSPEINLEGFSKNVASIGFQCDSSRLFSGGEDGVTRIWDLKTKNHQSQKMHVSSSAVNSVRLGNNQIELYMGQQSGHISVWDTRTNLTVTTQIDQHDRIDSNVSVQSIALSPDGKLLAAVDNIGYCHIYSIKGSQSLEASTIESHQQLETTPLSAIGSTPSPISSQSSIESSSSSSSFQTFRRLKKWKAHTSYTLKCLFSDNNAYLVTTSADNKAKVWKVQDILRDNNNTTSTASPATSIVTPPPSTNIAPVTSDPVATNVTMATNRSSHPIINIAPEKEQPLKPFVELTAENQRWVWDAAFSADSQFLFTASSDNLVRLWDVKTGEVRRVYVGHQKPVTALAFSDC